MARERTDGQVLEEAGTLLLTAYVLDALGFLPEARKQHLTDAVRTCGGADWSAVAAREVRDEYGLDGKGLRTIYAACVKQMNGLHSLMFVLRGWGSSRP